MRAYWEDQAVYENAVRVTLLETHHLFAVGVAVEACIAAAGRLTTRYERHGTIDEALQETILSVNAQRCCCKSAMEVGTKSLGFGRWTVGEVVVPAA